MVSHGAYEKQQALIELYQKLALAEKQSNEGLTRKSHKEVMNKIRSKIQN
jgi:hypothetical protein